MRVSEEQETKPELPVGLYWNNGAKDEAMFTPDFDKRIVNVWMRMGCCSTLRFTITFEDWERVLRGAGGQARN